MRSGYIAEELKKYLPNKSILTGEPMSKHTTFKIGGPADCIVLPGSIDELKAVLEVCSENKIEYYVIGNGSDLLVSDNGYEGVIIKINRLLSEVTIDETVITAQCGISLASLSTVALENGLGGLEFSQGIPGTLGGGIYMNCGAYGSNICDVVKSVTIMSKSGMLTNVAKEEMKFGYRTSLLQQNGAIAVQCELQLEKYSRTLIYDKMKDMAKKRQQSQPLEFPSAGSVFKRPENNFAGKLIEEAGLKGYKIGGAQVSEKHGGFIINTGGATANDVQALIKYCQDIVYERSKVSLEPEIIFVGG